MPPPMTGVWRATLLAAYLKWSTVLRRTTLGTHAKDKQHENNEDRKKAFEHS